MKHIILPLIATICLISCKQQEITTTENIVPKQEYVEAPTYKLYPTENMWNFLKLNTATGQITIVQYAINDDDKRFEYSLNDQSLLSPNEDIKAGRFELTATQNRWNFIMLDQVTGATYQVQWSFEEENRFILPIR